MSTVAKIENEEMKKEIMWNKNKLRGLDIYIENDLSWEDRKVQENINKWVREKRARGEDVKVGYGKVKIKGIWKNWLEIMKEEDREREERLRKDGEVGEKGDNQDFS